MPKPLITVARYGNQFEVTKFEKPLIEGRRRANIFFRRPKNAHSLKLIPNIQRTKRRIRHTVQVATYIRGAPAFATFTYKNQQHDMQQAIEDWRQFTRRMKKNFPAVSFIRVPERHKKGGVHFHAIMYGLPKELPCIYKRMRGRYIHDCPKNRACERKLRSVATVWERGFVDVQAVRSVDAVGSYISQYLTKGDQDWSLFGNHLASANTNFHNDLSQGKKRGVYFRMSSFKSPVAVDTTIAEYIGTEVKTRTHEFDTLWLGHAVYTCYTLPPASSFLQGESPQLQSNDP